MNLMQFVKDWTNPPVPSTVEHLKKLQDVLKQYAGMKLNRQEKMLVEMMASDLATQTKAVEHDAHKHQRAETKPPAT